MAQLRVKVADVSGSTVTFIQVEAVGAESGAANPFTLLGLEGFKVGQVVTMTLDGGGVQPGAQTESDGIGVHPVDKDGPGGQPTQ